MTKNFGEYSIGDVAKKLNLPVHTIRFWTEEFKKIKELSHKKGLKIEGIKQMLRYHKIDMEKLDKANKIDFQAKLEQSLKKIDKIIDLVLKS